MMAGPVAPPQTAPWNTWSVQWNAPYPWQPAALAAPFPWQPTALAAPFPWQPTAFPAPFQAAPPFQPPAEQPWNSQQQVAWPSFYLDWI